MESLARMMVAGLEVVEAEGRVLKQQVMRLAIAIALGIIVTIMLIMGLAFLVWGLFLFLAKPLGQAGAATVFGLVAIVTALAGAWIVRAILLPAKPKTHKALAEEARTKIPAEREEDIAQTLDEATGRAQAHTDRVPDNRYAPAQ
jgi:uncharacterized membrane protein YqjE